MKKPPSVRATCWGCGKVLRSGEAHSEEECWRLHFEREDRKTFPVTYALPKP